MPIRPIITICLLAGSLYAKTPVLTLDRLLELASEHNPTLQQAKLQAKRAGVRIRTIRGATRLPRVDLTLLGGGARQRLKHLPSQNYTLLSGSLHASQLLYDFGKSGAQIAQAQALRQAAEATLHARLLELFAQVKQAYYETLSIRGRIEVAKRDIALQRRQLHRAKRYMQAGIRTVIDVSDAKLRLQQAQRRLADLRFLLQNSRAKLERLVGTAPYGGRYRLAMPKLDFDRLDRTLPRRFAPLASLQRQALRYNPAVAYRQALIAQARASRRESASEYYPTLSLQGDYTRSDVDEALQAVQPESQGSVGVALQWNLFNGFATDRRVEEKRLGELEAHQGLIETRNKIKEAVTVAYNNLQRARQDVSLLAGIVRLAHQKHTQALKRYENDLADFIELQQAQQEYIQALGDLVVGYFGYFTAQAQLERVLGR